MKIYGQKLKSQLKSWHYLALTFSQNIKAQNTFDSLNKNPQDFLKVGLGFQVWDKIKPYKNFNYLDVGFEKILTKGINLDGGFDYGSQKEETDNEISELVKLSIRIGLNKYF